MMPQPFDEEDVLLVRSNEVEEFILHNGEHPFAREALERKKADYYSQYTQTLQWKPCALSDVFLIAEDGLLDCIETVNKVD